MEWFMLLCSMSLWDLSQLHQIQLQNPCSRNSLDLYETCKFSGQTYRFGGALALQAEQLYYTPRIDKTYHQDRTSSEPPRRRPRLVLVPGVIVPPPRINTKHKNWIWMDRFTCIAISIKKMIGARMLMSVKTSCLTFSIINVSGRLVGNLAC
jgi:hypothetical protein